MDCVEEVGVQIDDIDAGCRGVFEAAHSPGIVREWTLLKDVVLREAPTRERVGQSEACPLDEVSCRRTHGLRSLTESRTATQIDCPSFVMTSGGGTIGLGGNVNKASTLS